MKPTEFIVETSSIAQEADIMHRDHEVQMARSDCYNAANYAIQLHRLLKNISEAEGLDGWVSEKITLANDYLRSVYEYLRHEEEHTEDDMMVFAEDAANYAFSKLLNESLRDGEYYVYEVTFDDGSSTKIKTSNDWFDAKTYYAKRGKNVVKAEQVGGIHSDNFVSPRRTSGLDQDKQDQTNQALRNYDRGLTKGIEEEYPATATKPIVGQAPTVAAGAAVPPTAVTQKPAAGANLKPTPTLPGTAGAGKAGQPTNPELYTDPRLTPGAAKPVQESYVGRETKEGTWRVFKNGQAVAVAGPFKSREEASAWIKKQSKKSVKESASAGATGAGGIAVSMSGGNGKPGTGKPKKIGNAAKMKKVQYGKGIY